MPIVKITLDATLADKASQLAPQIKEALLNTINNLFAPKPGTIQLMLIPSARVLEGCPITVEVLHRANSSRPKDIRQQLSDSIAQLLFEQFSQPVRVRVIAIAEPDLAATDIWE